MLTYSLFLPTNYPYFLHYNFYLLSYTYGIGSHGIRKVGKTWRRESSVYGLQHRAGQVSDIDRREMDHTCFINLWREGTIPINPLSYLTLYFCVTIQTIYLQTYTRYTYTI